MGSPLRNLVRVNPMPAQTTQLSPSSTKPSIWTTTVPAFLSPPLMRELMSLERLPKLTVNTSSGDTAPTNQSDARIATDTKSVLPEKEKSIPPISSSSTEFTPGKTEPASKLEDLRLKSMSSSQKLLPTDGISIKVLATKVECIAKNGET